MKKLFISQPMKGKTDEEILKERDEFIKNNSAGDIYINYCNYLKTKYK